MYLNLLPIQLIDQRTGSTRNAPVCCNILYHLDSMNRELQCVYIIWLIILLNVKSYYINASNS